MDRFATLTLFTRIVERGSFSAAAADLGVSRPVATAAIKALEARLGTRLGRVPRRGVAAAEPPRSPAGAGTLRLPGSAG